MRFLTNPFFLFFLGLFFTFIVGYIFHLSGYDKYLTAFVYEIPYQYISDRNRAWQVNNVISTIALIMVIILPRIFSKKIRKSVNSKSKAQVILNYILFLIIYNPFLQLFLQAFSDA